MADKIEKKDISVKDPAGDYIKSMEAALVITKDVEDAQIELLKTEKKLLTQRKKPTNVKEIKALNQSISKTNKTVKTLNDTRKVSIQIDKEKEKELLKLKKLSTDRIQDVVTLKRLTKEQNAINKDTEIINNKAAGTLEKLAARNRQLIRAQSKVNLETEKGRKDLKKINAELDKNNKVIRKNSSALQKQKIDIGGYSKGIKEAAEASGVFGKILGPLNQIQATLTALTNKDTVAKDVNAVATTSLSAKQKAMALTTGTLTKATKAFNFVLKKSPIFLAAAAIGGLIAFFTRSQKGIDTVTKSLAGLSAGFDVVLDRFQIVGEGIFAVVEGLASFDSDKIAEGLDTIKNAFSGIILEIKEESAVGFKLKELIISLTREQKLFEAQQASSITQVKKLTVLVKDKLKADQERLDAVKEINKIEIGLAERQIELQEQSLAAAFETISADQKRLELTKEEIQFVDDLKNGNLDIATAAEKARNFTLGRANAEEALFGIIDKIVEQEHARQNLLEKQSVTAKRTASIVKEIATKKAMGLVREAQALRQVAKDQEETIERRIELLTEAAAKEIESFKIQASANIKNEQEVAAAKLQINAKLQADIKKLFGKGEDFEAIARKQVKVVNDIEQELLQQDINRLKRRLEVEDLSKDERIKILDEIFETEKTKAQAQAEFLLTNENLTAEEREFISLKLGKTLEDIENDRVDSVKKANEEILKSEEDLQLQREMIADARINTAKNLADALGTLAGEDEEAQKAAQRLSAILAIAEIRQNLAKEESAIRERNADKENAAALNSAQITQAKTAAAAGVISILAAQFAEGGYTGDGGKYDVAGTVHKGEFVNTKDQTSKYGMKGWTASDFDKNVKEGYFNQFAGNDLLMSPHSFKQLELGRTITPNEVSYKKMISEQKTSTATLKKAIEANRPILKVYRDGDGNQVNDENRGGRRRLTTYKKDRNRL